MAIKITKQDVIWNYLGNIMTLGSNFLLLPFMIVYLDGDELGLWYVFLSIGSIATLFNFGFAPTLARNIAYCWSGTEELNKKGVTFVEKRETNIFLLVKVIATCKRIYLIIAILALCVLVSIGTLYILYISRDLASRPVFLAVMYFVFNKFSIGIHPLLLTVLYFFVSLLLSIAATFVLNKIPYGYYFVGRIGVGTKDKDNSSKIVHDGKTLPGKA